jgi:hypothetical protein
MPAPQNSRPSPGRVAASLFVWAVVVCVAVCGLVFAVGAVFAASVIGR